MGTNVTSAGNLPSDRPVSPDVTVSFESFYHGTSPRLLRFAYGLTGDMSEAQDFTQEAYTRAWQRWSRVQNYDHPESWLRLVVTRMATDKWRWLKVRRDTPLPVEQYQPGPDAELINVVAAMKKLPIQQRKALVLHYFLDQPVADIATETGVSVNTVKSWLLRGRLNLAGQLTEAIPPLPDTAQVKRKVKRRRTIAMAIATFFTAATAAAAAFLVFPHSTAPALHPDLVFPYGSKPRAASVLRVGHQVITSWDGLDHLTHVGAINLETGKPSWPAFDLPKSPQGMALVGERAGILLFYGPAPDVPSENFVLVGVEAATGEIRWVHQGGVPLDMLGAAIVLRENGTTKGVDMRTGEEVWVFPAADMHGRSDGARFAEVMQDGMLTLQNLQSGRTISVRYGVPVPPEPHNAQVIGDWLYMMSQNGGLQRIALTGPDAAIQLSSHPINDVRPCGTARLCASGPRYAAIFAEDTGKLLWQMDVANPGAVTADGFSVLVRDPVHLGELDYDRELLFSFDGNDITPAALGHGTMYSLGDGEFIFSRGPQTQIYIDPAGITPAHESLSVYDQRTGQERKLGDLDMYGGCAGTKGKYVCATADGFVMFK